MKDKLYLMNILESVELIEKYVKGKKELDLRRSPMIRDAVSKRFEEIGENINKLSPTLKKNKKVMWKEFVEVRNFLTHVYQMVNVLKLWNVIKKDLPSFKKEILKIKKELK